MGVLMIRSFKTSLFYIAFGASFSLLFPPINYASESTLTCSNDEGFLSVFKVNKSLPSVTHISSYDPNSNERFSVNSKLKVISSEQNKISTIDVLIEDNMIILDVFDLKKNTIASNTIYLDGSSPDLQIYSCN